MEELPESTRNRSKQFESKLSDNLYKLWNRMASGSYFPPPVKAVPIPKKCGGTRMLGVPTVADRVAQTVVKMVLEPMLEPVFDRDSFGYRPGRSALDAVALVRRRSWEYDWVVEFDIKGLFDNIDHELLLRAVRKHCQQSLGTSVHREMAEGAYGDRKGNQWRASEVPRKGVCLRHQQYCKKSCKLGYPHPQRVSERIFSGVA